MAARIGYTLRALREMDPAACETDAKLVFRDGDQYNMAILQRGELLNLRLFCGARELRLLGLQMLALAEHLSRESDDPFEVVMP